MLAVDDINLGGSFSKTTMSSSNSSNLPTLSESYITYQ